MPRHFEQRFMPFAPQQLFKLVSDVEAYPAFLPWCEKVAVRDRYENGMKADMTVGYKGLAETFTSIVSFDPPHQITVRFGGGSLKRLETQWRFDPKDGGCLISFQVDFTLRSVLLGGLMEIFFDRAFLKMVKAFEERAFALYGVPSSRFSDPGQG